VAASSLRFRVKVASVITLYHLVQVRAAWREALTGNRRRHSVVAPVTQPDTPKREE
jgi:hypothetical protein